MQKRVNKKYTISDRAIDAYALAGYYGKAIQERWKQARKKPKKRAAPVDILLEW
jgi:hypothetical protein